MVGVGPSGGTTVKGGRRGDGSSTTRLGLILGCCQRTWGVTTGRFLAFEMGGGGMGPLMGGRIHVAASVSKHPAEGKRMGVGEKGGLGEKLQSKYPFKFTQR